MGLTRPSPQLTTLHFGTSHSTIRCIDRASSGMSITRGCYSSSALFPGGFQPPSSPQIYPILSTLPRFRDATLTTIAWLGTSRSSYVTPSLGRLFSGAGIRTPLVWRVVSHSQRHAEEAARLAHPFRDTLIAQLQVVALCALHIIVTAIHYKR